MNYKLSSLLAAIAVVIFSLVSPAQSGQNSTPENRRSAVVMAAEGLNALLPNAPWTWLLLGRANQLDGRTAQAEAALLKVLEENPRSLAGHVWLGQIYLSQEQYDKAREHFESALGISKRDYNALVGLGTVAARTDKREEAIAKLTEALDIYPNGIDALMQLGGMYAAQEDTQSRAITVLQLAYSRRPEDIALNLELGRLLYARREYVKAAYFYSKASTIEPREGSHFLKLGKSLYYCVSYEEALKQLRRADRLLPKDPEVQYYLGAVYLANKNYARAAQTFQKADRLAGAGGYRDTLFFIGQAEFHQGLHRRAYDSLLRFRAKRLVESSTELGAATEQLSERALAESMDLMLEIEGILGIKRLPNQVPGAVDPAYMKSILGGTYTYGGFRGGDGKRGHSFEVTVGYYAIDLREVSCAEYEVFVKATGRERLPRADDSRGAIRRFDWDPTKKTYPESSGDLPVVNVAWEDAVAYAAWVGKRLPTEAEWERAARGGLEGKLYPWGDRPPTEQQACYGLDEDKGPRPVGEAEPNRYGLLHMVGNAAEWCSDWYDANLYRAAGTRNNFRGVPFGSQRSYRGGHWRSGEIDIQVAARGGLDPNTRSPYVGFRCAVDLPSGDKPGAETGEKGEKDEKNGRPGAPGKPGADSRDSGGAR